VDWFVIVEDATPVCIGVREVHIYHDNHLPFIIVQISLKN
jgi:hypothetical protein